MALSTTGLNPNGQFGRQRSNVPFSSDGSIGGIRIDKYNEPIIESLWNTYHMLGIEGSLFIAQTATPGTGITLTSATGTTYSDTNAIIGINNLSTGTSLSGPGLDVIPLWLKLVITAAGTAGTDSHVASRLDPGTAARSSGGTQLTGYAASGSYGASDSTAAIFAGAITVAASSTKVRNLGRAELRKAAAPCYIVGDVIMFLFGVIESVSPQAITPTTATMVTCPMPPVIIGPGQSWVLNEWMTARSAAQSAEIELGYVVR